MKHPTSKQVQTVIDNLKKVLPMANDEMHLNMTETKVNGLGHICGTVHCHGGWYAVSCCDLSIRVGYSTGAETMAEHLGFESQDELEAWAMSHEGIWGNSNGLAVFSSQLAFKSDERPNGALTLRDIIDHWEEVRDRIIAIENENKEA